MSSLNFSKNGIRVARGRLARLTLFPQNQLTSTRSLNRPRGRFKRNRKLTGNFSGAASLASISEFPNGQKEWIARRRGGAEDGLFQPQEAQKSQKRGYSLCFLCLFVAKNRRRPLRFLGLPVRGRTRRFFVTLCLRVIPFQLSSVPVREVLNRISPEGPKTQSFFGSTGNRFLPDRKTL